MLGSMSHIIIITDIGWTVSNSIYTFKMKLNVVGYILVQQETHSYFLYSSKLNTEIV